MAEIENLVDIKGSEHLAPEYGERFRGWYFTKTQIKVEELLLNYKDSGLKYSFKVCDYHYQFIMPSMLVFKDGLITYTEGERRFGIFRYPRDKDGHFQAPLSLKKIEQNILTLSEDDIKSLIKDRQVLTFEAFRISQFGFQYFDMTEDDFGHISEMTEKYFSRRIAEDYHSGFITRRNEVFDKITETPNYLLILQNVLDFYWKDMDQVATMSNNIIHI